MPASTNPTSLSDYSWIDANSIADIGFGVGRRDGKGDANIVVKNVFDDQTYQNRTWNSYTLPARRWFGIVFSGKI